MPEATEKWPAPSRGLAILLDKAKIRSYFYLRMIPNNAYAEETETADL
jgi:hypothetical protein